MRDSGGVGASARWRAGQFGALGTREPHRDSERVLRAQRPIPTSEFHVVPMGRQLLRDDPIVLIGLIAYAYLWIRTNCSAVMPKIAKQTIDLPAQCSRTKVM